MLIKASDPLQTAVRFSQVLHHAVTEGSCSQVKP